MAGDEKTFRRWLGDRHLLLKGGMQDAADTNPTYDLPALAARAARDLVDVLIVTATDVEREAVRSKLRAIPGASGVARVRSERQTFYVGRLGRYLVVHVECTMGSVGIAGSQNTVSDAIDFWDPKLVVMPGIAFGANPRKQSLEDVLISSAVVSYEPARIGPGTVVRRGQEIPAGPIILDRMRDQRGRGSASAPATHVGLLLSGEKLVDDPGFKSDLLAAYPTAVGGEMEGAGVASVCQRRGIEWILVKAICDWGDGKKNKKHQAAAARNAVALIEDAFSSLELHPSLSLAPRAERMRLLTGTRCSFLRSPEDLGDVARLFADARAVGYFGAQLAQDLEHAARELARNSLVHGSASCVAIEIGENEIVVRDDGGTFDPRRLASRLRAPGREAGSLVMSELLDQHSHFLACAYERDERIGQNEFRARLTREPDRSIVDACTVATTGYCWDSDWAASKLAGTEGCSEVYYDAGQNPDLSSQWRYVHFLLESLRKDQLLVVLNCDDRLGLAMLSELSHPQLVIRPSSREPDGAG